VLLVLALMCLGAAVYFVGDLVTQSGREREFSVKRAARYGKLGVRARPQQARFRQRVMLPLRDWSAALVLKTNPRMSLEVVQTKILSAGLGRRLTATGFLALKGFGVVGGLVLALLLGATSRGAIGLFFILAFSACGFFAPDGLLTMKIRKRKDEIGAALPDALDLLAVSVEAGLGFDGAIAKLTEHMEGPLIDEFELALGEMRVGESRSEALRRMAERVPAPEMSQFVRAIIQADQLGISLGRLLRVQATDARLKRQAAAEEKAMKAPIKMLFPLVMFIFPAMFIVILGPAFLNLGKLFQL
jgi:tight adherence protein C